jgi:hypothetical protein
LIELFTWPPRNVVSYQESQLLGNHQVFGHGIIYPATFG